MGGRGSGSGMKTKSSNAVRENSFAASLVDSLDFDEFVSQNLKNPDFMRIGREEGMDAIKQLWYEKRISEEIKGLHEIDPYDAVDQVRDAIPQSVSDGWFRNADSGYKPKLVDCIVSNPGTLNAGLNIAYRNYRDANGTASFEEWLRTPQTMYRGDKGQTLVAGDIFVSFTPDRSIAKKFGDNITVRSIRPIDTWGSYQTTGEQEFLIPVKRK